VVRPATEGDNRPSGPAPPYVPLWFRLWRGRCCGSCHRSRDSRRVDRLRNRKRSQDGPTQDSYDSAAEHAYDFAATNVDPADRLGDGRINADARSDSDC
jgi:hypothetical protein